MKIFVKALFIFLIASSASAQEGDTQSSIKAAQELADYAADTVLDFSKALTELNSQDKGQAINSLNDMQKYTKLRLEFQSCMHASQCKLDNILSKGRNRFSDAEPISIFSIIPDRGRIIPESIIYLSAASMAAVVGTGVSYYVLIPSHVVHQISALNLTTQSIMAGVAGYFIISATLDFTLMAVPKIKSLIQKLKGVPDKKHIEAAFNERLRMRGLNLTHSLSDLNINDLSSRLNNIKPTCSSLF